MWFDFKNTHDPILTKEFMEFRFVGEFNANGKGCEVFQPKDMTFLDDVKTSQLAISEAAANCYADRLQHTKVAHFHLNKRVLNVVANDSSVDFKEELEFNTTSLYDIMPMFHDKLGPNKSLEMFMSYTDMEVHLGRYHDWGSDVALEFTGRLQVKLLKGENPELKNTEVFYDELKMRAMVDLQIVDDVLFAKVNDLRIHLD